MSWQPLTWCYSFSVHSFLSCLSTARGSAVRVRVRERDERDGGRRDVDTDRCGVCVVVREAECARSRSWR